MMHSPPAAAPLFHFVCSPTKYCKHDKVGTLPSCGQHKK